MSELYRSLQKGWRRVEQRLPVDGVQSLDINNYLSLAKEIETDRLRTMTCVKTEVKVHGHFWRTDQQDIHPYNVREQEQRHTKEIVRELLGDVIDCLNSLSISVSRKGDNETAHSIDQIIHYILSDE